MMLGTLSGHHVNSSMFNDERLENQIVYIQYQMLSTTKDLRYVDALSDLGDCARIYSARLQGPNLVLEPYYHVTLVVRINFEGI